MNDLASAVEHASLLQHLNMLKRYGLLSKLNTQGTIVYADDQFINRQALALTFLSDKNLSERFKIYQDGKQVLDHFDELILNKIPEKAEV